MSGLIAAAPIVVVDAATMEAILRRLHKMIVQQNIFEAAIGKGRQHLLGDIAGNDDTSGKSSGANCGGQAEGIRRKLMPREQQTIARPGAIFFDAEQKKRLGGAESRIVA